MWHLQIFEKGTQLKWLLEIEARSLCQMRSL